MKILVFAVVVTCAFGQVVIDRSDGSDASQIYTGYFTNKLDHFRPQDGRFFNFTYHANLGWYRPNGPMFVYVNENLDGTKWIRTGLFADIAKKTNGALFTFDLRYFGENIPTKSASFDQLEFLTVEQILADISLLIRTIKNKHNGAISKVIVCGSGYGATIATYARKKYPHLISGAWSSSGIYEISLFSVEVQDSLTYPFERIGGNECKENIVNTFRQISYLIGVNETNVLQQMFNSCNTIDQISESDISAFFEYRYRQLIDYINQFHANGLVELCRSLSELDDPLESFAKWVNVTFRTKECIADSYAELVESYMNVNWQTISTESGKRQWLYLQCTQTGLFLITDEFSLFPHTISTKYHIQKCKDIFGSQYDFRLAEIANENLRTEYGSFNQLVTNVVYVNGELDPFLYAGFQYTDTPLSFVYEVQYYSKSSDLTSRSENESPQLSQVKTDIENRIMEFISN